MGLIVGLNKKDIKEIVHEEVINFNQDVLKIDQYKSYITSYSYLYKKSLENIFDGGYMTFGIRDSSVFDCGNFTNPSIDFKIKGQIVMNKNQINILMDLEDVLFQTDHLEVSEIQIGMDIKDYRIGQIYNGNLSTSSWYSSVIILDDNLMNPVLVFGFRSK